MSNSIPFTEKESDKLKNERNADFGCFLISLPIFLFLSGLFFWMVFSGILRGLILLIPFGFFFGYFIVKSFRSWRKVRFDLRTGSKQNVIAPVEGKRVKFERNKKSGKRYRLFFLRAGGFTVRVSNALYDEIKEGEFIEFQIAPHSEIVFSEPKKL
ncbi:MAG: hypothetical protein K1X72_29320 [Pyrinomonadaceae bacterium]|nr:hypothetical protein [Pyrinomonadaceae bacterium]